MLNVSVQSFFEPSKRSPSQLPSGFADPLALFHPWSAGATISAFYWNEIYEEPSLALYWHYKVRDTIKAPSSSSSSSSSLCSSSISRHSHTNRNGVSEPGKSAQKSSGKALLSPSSFPALGQEKLWLSLRDLCKCVCVCVRELMFEYRMRETGSRNSFYGFVPAMGSHRLTQQQQQQR